MIVSKCEIELAPHTAAVDKYFYSMFRMEVGYTHHRLTLPDIEERLEKFTRKYREVKLRVELDYRKRIHTLEAEEGKVRRLPQRDKLI